MPFKMKGADGILRVLPMRITERSYSRLVARRDIDGLAVQEHVRRALDLYLDYLDGLYGPPDPTVALMIEALRIKEVTAQNIEHARKLAKVRKLTNR